MLGGLSLAGTTPACAAEQPVALTVLKQPRSLPKRSGRGKDGAWFLFRSRSILRGRVPLHAGPGAVLAARAGAARCRPAPRKGELLCKHGQLLPPYDSRETLERLALAIRETGARRVYTLGDNFHDSAGTERLEPHAAGMLAALTRATDWVWITGNHDASMEAKAGGALAEELDIAGIVLRHRAKAGETRPELSGHYHPRLQVTVRERHIRRPCAVVSPRCGGGRADDPAGVRRADRREWTPPTRRSSPRCSRRARSTRCCRRWQAGAVPAVASGVILLPAGRGLNP
jgi:hypothetical protein